MSKTLFTPVPRTVRELIMEVETGKLGLPDLQRGYVWRAAKVRDLLDSMLKGYPIGYLMIWDAADDTEKSKTIGIDNKRKIIAAIFANGFNCRFWNVISHTTPPSLYSPARHGWQVQYSRGEGKWKGRWESGRKNKSPCK